MNWNKNNNDNNPWGSGNGNNPWGGGNSNNYVDFEDSIKKAREKSEAVRRSRKLARKKLQRESMVS